MWRRLPTYFPNIRLQMLPLTKEQHTQLLDTGWLREVAFKTEPRVNKLEIKAFLEAVHGMAVERVDTINYQGKKKRRADPKGKPHWVRLSDWKKAYVVFKPPPGMQQQWEQQRQQRADEQRAAAEKQQLERRLPRRLRGLLAAGAGGDGQVGSTSGGSGSSAESSSREAAKLFPADS